MTTLKDAIPQRLQPVARSAYYAAYRSLLRVDWWMRDRLWSLAPNAESPLPPAKLRFRVGETADPTAFRPLGRRTAENLQGALTAAVHPLASAQAVLDFGCGCGRTLLWLTRQFPDVQWHGTDVDPEAIAWCQRFLPGARFTVNGPLPPLPHQDCTLDVIYGVSVFTHLPEDYQRAWLPELHRILKPGGVLLLSFHSEHVWKPTQDSGAVERNGFVFRTSTKLSGIMPEWYQRLSRPDRASNKCSPPSSRR